jgi:outer membrane protein OmpA-like peptidoglycan-associated protein
MMREAIVSALGVLLCALPAACQGNGTVPLYRVTVVQRSVDAINYQYRSGPTQIGFTGTVLLPKSKGEATVESKRGHTEIEARFEHLDAPSRFGREYLTYVLWAITPEGRPRNLGELVADAGDKSKVHVSTDLQAFGLLVTAEPYSAVRQPSDVVVLENKIRPDTIGKVEPIEVKYELMPRGQYTWQEPANLQASVANAPKVSMDRYEALLELYQAQNAIGIARVARADQYAPNTFAKAEQLLAEAQRLDQFKGNSRLVVQSAREAAQTAEDARAIAERREQDEKVARAQADVSVAQQAKAQADVQVVQARNEADVARAQADAERAARERAEADAAAARDRAAQAEADAAASRARPAIQSGRQIQEQAVLQKSEMRMRLLEQLNGFESTRDTPRGLVVTVPDTSFDGSQLKGTSTEQVARIGRILAAQPGLRVQIEGYTDGGNSEALSASRAQAVQGVLLGAGVPANMTSARGLGDSRLITSNATASGRVENRRVEIVVSGESLGSLPYWDHPYSLLRK